MEIPTFWSKRKVVKVWEKLTFIFILSINYKSLHVQLIGVSVRLGGWGVMEIKANSTLLKKFAHGICLIYIKNLIWP